MRKMSGIEDLKYVDKNGLLYRYMQDKISKDPNAEKLYNEAVQELNFSIMIKELRKELNLSQQQLAQKMGKAQSTIGRIENGSVTPTIPMLEEIAAATNTKLEISFVR